MEMRIKREADSIRYMNLAALSTALSRLVVFLVVGVGLIW
jgi:hypothetical protein